MSDPQIEETPAIHGWAFPPLSSRRKAARLLTRAPLPGEGNSAEDLIVDLMEGDRVVASAPMSGLEVDIPVGRAPRKLTFPNGALFETEDHVAIQGLVGQTHGDWLHRSERFHPRLIGVVVVLIGACYVIWRWGLDMMVTVAIALTPPIVVEQLDKGTLRTIDLTMGAKETALSQEDRERVRGVFDALVAALPPDVAQDHRFELQFRSMPRVGPNAFALPAGTVVMTDQFVTQFPQDNVLAGVLGHEIGHVVERHGLRQTYRALGIYVIVGLMAGETGPFVEEILLEGNLLLSFRFSRAHETAADRFGVALSKEAGFDPLGLSLFFADMAKRGGQPPEWLSTHPSSAKRVEQIEALARELE